MSHADDQMKIRMPTGMRGVLKERAQRNRRSMNAEAVLLIERGLAAEKTASNHSA